MKEQCYSSLSDFDPEEMEQMERQLARIYAEKEEQAEEARFTCFIVLVFFVFFSVVPDTGEAVDWTNYTETTLEANPLCVVKKVVETANEQTVDLPAPSSKSTKKHSASSAIKQKLLQDISEGRNIDIDATKAAAKRDDYRNTFCYQCRIDFYSPKGLYVHNLKTHPEGEVKCDVCLKPLKNRITLMKHKKLHLGAEDLQCICTYCGKKLKDKRALSVHISFAGHMNGVPET
uniref:C2H2-type domain-containing protein n=1 Tax=Angiostrongylus cantonensis TaxID=6313 RepID=A0A0K0DL23_ANGCA